MWVAGSTGLEPAASGVTGRRSNQLNYDPERTDGELQILDCGLKIDWRLDSARLSLQRIPIRNLQSQIFNSRILVGGTGFEPVTAGV